MDSLYIKNFKNFHELTVENVGKINLIVGKNNVGKSSLLEAISIYVTNGEESWLRELLASRGEEIVEEKGEEVDAEKAKEHYVSLFAQWEENYSPDFAITIGENVADKNAVHISQTYIKESRKNSSTIWETFGEEDLGNNVNRNSITGAGIIVRVGEQTSIIPYSKGRSFLNTFNDKFPFQYVPIDAIQSISNAKLFDKISLSPEEDYVLEALQIINPAIRKIGFVETNERRKSERIAVVTIEGENKRFRLSSMGDGINRILTIILKLVNCKNGVFLLDEFETGLHYSVQTQLWQLIFMLADKLNIQVFVTSHSNDCIRSFAEANKDGKGRLIRLTERKGEIVSTVYADNEDIKYAVENDIEIR